MGRYMLPLHFATVPRSTGLKPLSYTNPERKRLNTENTEGRAQRSERKAKRPAGCKRYKVCEEGRLPRVSALVGRHE